MPHLASFAAPANAAVIGASGGIGGAFVRHLVADAAVEQVHAIARTRVERDRRKVIDVAIDISDESTVRDAAATVAANGPLDLVIVATGILHDAAGVRPEKRMLDLDATTMSRVFAINAIGPALVAKHFLPLMRRGRKSVFAALSARVGSIGDNRLGGWASYRASKAALNMLLKTLAIEQARTIPDCIVVGLHPGTVDTRLSKPFQRGVPEGRLFTPDYAAERLLAVIDRLDKADTGSVFAWDGAPIPH